jgi:prephenate dehydrogenase
VSSPMRVGVVGSGLIGTSAAMALLDAGHEVLLSDVDPEVVGRAMAISGARAWVPAADAELDALLDVVLIAVPPAATGGLIATLSRLNPHITVSDVCSVKTQPLLEAEQRGAVMANVVGGHPVAGREISGPQGAVRDLFRDRPWVLCPGPQTSGRALHRMDVLVRACGASPVVMTAASHDVALATVSHMPQVVASAVAAALQNLDEKDVRLAGPGVRDVTRIAGSDPTLWSEILQANEPAVRAAVMAVHDRLGQLLKCAPREFGAEAASLITAGRVGRERLPTKGDRARAWSWLWVRVPDRPGELGRILVAAGAAGINVEDLRVQHADTGITGWALLAVDEVQAEELMAELICLGWDVELHTDGGDAGAH